MVLFLSRDLSRQDGKHFFSVEDTEGVTTVTKTKEVTEQTVGMCYGGTIVSNEIYHMK